MSSSHDIAARAASAGGEGIFVVPEGSCLDEDVFADDRDGRLRARQDGLCGGDQWTIDAHKPDPPGPGWSNRES